MRLDRIQIIENPCEPVDSLAELATVEQLSVLGVNTMIKKRCLILLLVMIILGRVNAQTTVDLKAMLSDDACTGLCFMGIENGVTTLDEIEIMLQAVDIPYKIDSIDANGYLKWVDFTPTMYPNYISSVALQTGKTVIEIRINTQNITIDDVVANFGLPSFVSEGYEAQGMVYLPEEVSFEVDRATGNISQILLRNRGSFRYQVTDSSCTSNTLACTLPTNPIPIITAQTIYDSRAGYTVPISTVGTYNFYSSFPDDAYLEIETFPLNVGSVRFTLDGQVYIDDSLPFELPLPTQGFYDITAEFFADSNLQSIADDTRHIYLYLVSINTIDNPASASDLILVNADEGVAYPVMNNKIYTLSPDQLASTFFKVNPER